MFVLCADGLFKEEKQIENPIEAGESSLENLMARASSSNQYCDERVELRTHGSPKSIGVADVAVNCKQHQGHTGSSCRPAGKSLANTVQPSNSCLALLVRHRCNLSFSSTDY